MTICHISNHPKNQRIVVKYVIFFCDFDKFFFFKKVEFINVCVPIANKAGGTNRTISHIVETSKNSNDLILHPREKPVNSITSAAIDIIKIRERLLGFFTFTHTKKLRITAKIATQQIIRQYLHRSNYNDKHHQYQY